MGRDHIGAPAFGAEIWYVDGLKLFEVGSGLDLELGEVVVPAEELVGCGEEGRFAGAIDPRAGHAALLGVLLLNAVVVVLESCV